MPWPGWAFLLDFGPTTIEICCQRHRREQGAPEGIPAVARGTVGATGAPRSGATTLSPGPARAADTASASFTPGAATAAAAGLPPPPSPPDEPNPP
jgi:hypothetical protein